MKEKIKKKTGIFIKFVIYGLILVLAIDHFVQNEIAWTLLIILVFGLLLFRMIKDFKNIDDGTYDDKKLVSKAEKKELKNMSIKEQMKYGMSIGHSMKPGSKLKDKIKRWKAKKNSNE